MLCCYIFYLPRRRGGEDEDDVVVRCEVVVEDGGGVLCKKSTCFCTLVCAAIEILFASFGGESLVTLLSLFIYCCVFLSFSSPNTASPFSQVLVISPTNTRLSKWNGTPANKQAEKWMDTRVNITLCMEKVAELRIMNQQNLPNTTTRHSTAETAAADFQQSYSIFAVWCCFQRTCFASHTIYIHCVAVSSLYVVCRSLAGSPNREEHNTTTPSPPFCVGVLQSTS